jgi:hypothetical protein
MDPDKRRNVRAEITFIENDKFFVAGKRPVSGDSKRAAFGRQVRGGDTLDRFRPILQAAIMIARIVIAMYFVVHCIFNLNKIIAQTANIHRKARENAADRSFGAKRKRPAGYIRAGNE